MSAGPSAAFCTACPEGGLGSGGGPLTQRWRRAEGQGTVSPLAMRTLIMLGRSLCPTVVRPQRDSDLPATPRRLPRSERREPRKGRTHFLPFEGEPLSQVIYTGCVRLPITASLCVANGPPGGGVGGGGGGAVPSPQPPGEWVSLFTPREGRASPAPVLGEQRHGSFWARVGCCLFLPGISRLTLGSESEAGGCFPPAPQASGPPRLPGGQPVPTFLLAPRWDRSVPALGWGTA